MCVEQYSTVLISEPMLLTVHNAGRVLELYSPSAARARSRRSSASSGAAPLGEHLAHMNGHLGDV